MSVMGMMLRRRHGSTNNNNHGVTTFNAVAPSSPSSISTPKEPEEKKITRADIMKMNVATVRAYAESQGIEGANAISGAELKRKLCDKMFDEEVEEENEE